MGLDPTFQRDSGIQPEPEFHQPPELPPEPPIQRQPSTGKWKNYQPAQ